MKIANILCVVLLISGGSCNQALNLDQNLGIRNQIQFKEIKEQTYSTFSVNGFSLTLKNLNGKCVLFYKKDHLKTEQIEESITLDVAAPCEFVRKPGAIEEPSFRTYGKKTKITVGIVTGGKPHPRFADQFQPLGCGTEIQKILIYEDKIDKGTILKSIEVICPSKGLEEVFFAA